MNLSSLESVFLAFALAFASCQAGMAQTSIDVPAPDVLTPRQQAWNSAGLGGRMALAEEIGEEGGRAFAKSNGWKPVYDGKSWSMIHGPDQVYRGADGKIHMIEAKGGNSPLARGYGHAQGTSEWAVESAKRVLQNPTATAAERRGAAAVIEAARSGTLEVHVVRTPHTGGEPRLPRLEQTTKCSQQATALARQSLTHAAATTSKTAATVGHATDDAVRVADDAAKLGDDVARIADDALKASDDVARAASQSSGWIAGAAKVAGPAGVALDAGLRVKDGVVTERKFAAGEISSRERAIAHGRNAAGIAGGTAGAWAGAEGGAAGGAVIGSFICPGLGTAIGGFVGGLAGGVGGYFAGDALASAGAEAAIDAAW